MTEYQKTYIELKKQFVATNEGPDNVRALYTFKEELEQSEDQQAKEVLVDVYDLLPPSGITQTLWKLGLLRNPQTALSATAAARRPIFSIQSPFTLWRILHICAQSASPTAKQPGNMTAAFRTISLWTMA